MTVEDNNSVDIVSIDKGGRVRLTVSDHLDWSNSPEHQRILQDKLNCYLRFVESGEILEKYPSARGRSVVFEVVFMHKPDRDGELFLQRAAEVVTSAGFELHHRVFVSPESV